MCPFNPLYLIIVTYILVLHYYLTPVYTSIPDTPNNITAIQDTSFQHSFTMADPSPPVSSHSPNTPPSKLHSPPQISQSRVSKNKDKITQSDLLLAMQEQQAFITQQQELFLQE